MADFTEFELYLINRLDSIEAKVNDTKTSLQRDINKLHIKVIKSASIFGAMTGMITSIVAFLIKTKI